MRDAIAAESSTKDTQPILRHAALYLTHNHSHLPVRRGRWLCWLWPAAPGIG